MVSLTHGYLPNVGPDLYDLYEQQVEQMRCDVEDMSVAELVEEGLERRIAERSAGITPTETPMWGILEKETKD